MEDSKTLVLLAEAHANLTRKQTQHKDYKTLWEHHSRMMDNAHINLRAVEDEILFWTEKCTNYQRQLKEEMAVKYRPPTPPPPIQETVYNYVTVEKEVLVPKDVHIRSMCAHCGSLDREPIPVTEDEQTSNDTIANLTPEEPEYHITVGIQNEQRTDNQGC